MKAVDWLCRLCLLGVASLLVTCDHFERDIVPRKIVTSGTAAHYYVLPGSSTVVDLKSIVSSSFSRFTLKVSAGPTRGNLVFLDDFLHLYLPKSSFAQGEDHFTVAFVDEGKVLGTEVVTIHMLQDRNSFPCAMISVSDSVVTVPGSKALVQALSNDVFCGVERALVEFSIQTPPTRGEASLSGDTLVYVAEVATTLPGRISYRDEVVYRIKSVKGDSTKISYGLITIRVEEDACNLPPELNQILDLSDDVDDPFLDGPGCGGPGHYDLRVFERIRTYCTVDRWEMTSFISATTHSGYFCFDSDGYAYTPNAGVPAKNDTARFRVCANGECTTMTVYVRRTADFSGPYQVLSDNWSGKTVATGTPIYFQSVFFVDENSGYAVTSNIGILKTIDGGENWNKLILPISNINAIHSIYFIDSEFGFVGTSEGLLKTTDGGSNWTLIPFQYPVASVFLLSRTMGFAGTTQDPSDFGKSIFYKTTNGGASWNPVYSDNYSGVGEVCFASPSTGYALQFGKVLKTIDSGQSWTQIYSNQDWQGRIYGMGSLSIADDVLHGIIWAPDGNFFSGSFSRSTDGTDWVTLPLNPLTGLEFSPSGRLGFAINSDSRRPSIYSTHDNGRSWKPEDQSGYVPTSVAVASDRVAYLVCNDGKLLKYSNR